MKTFIKSITIGVFLMAIFSASARAAADIYCPSQVTCTRANDYSSCTIPGSTPGIWQHPTNPANFGATTFMFTYASSNYLGSVTCSYVGETWGVYYLSSTISTYPDIHYPGNSWEAHNLPAVCYSMSSDNCPITQTPTKKI